MIGLAEIPLVEDFLYEGALELDLKAENTRNLWIFVKYVNLAVTWPNRLLSSEFRGKVVIMWSNQRVLWLFVRIIFFWRNSCNSLKRCTLLTLGIGMDFLSYFIIQQDEIHAIVL